MNSKEQMSSEEKKAVSFDEIECCAIDSAFENIGNASAMAELRKTYPEAYTDKKNEFFKKTRGMTLSLKVFRGFLVEMQNLIQKESANLGEKSDLELLPCEHRFAEHKLALDRVMQKIEASMQ